MEMMRAARLLAHPEAADVVAVVDNQIRTMIWKARKIRLRRRTGRG
jgi:hypothetical protein